MNSPRQVHALRSSCVLTGMGALSPLGIGIPAFWEALAQGRHAIFPVQKFSTEAFQVHVAAEVPAHWREHLEGATQTPRDPCAEYGILAAKEAWRAASLDTKPVDSARIAVVLGTNMGGIASRSLGHDLPRTQRERRVELFQEGGCHIQTMAIAEALGAHGPLGTIVTACAASTNAVGYGMDLLATGDADVVLAGGADVLVPELFAGFYALGAMSSQPCAPFSEPPGMSLGEGAGFVVLERPEHAVSRGISPLVWLRGYGLSCDGHHPTTPDPRGRGVARSLLEALRHAQIEASHIDYLNAHGTGTEANDTAEWSGICAALGSRAMEIPISSTKSYFGHPQGAAGILEIIASVLAMQHQCVLPTLHFTQPRRHAPPDPVATSSPRPAQMESILKHNSAFGGANASLVISRSASQVTSELLDDSDDSNSSDTADVFAFSNDPIVVVGTGIVGAHGDGSIHQALQSIGPDASYFQRSAFASMREEFALDVWNGSVPTSALARWVRHPDLRELDASARFLTASASAALQQAKIQVNARLREQTGMISGVSGHSPKSAGLFMESLKQRGPTRGSSTAFAHSVLNAATGSACAVLSLQGLHSVLAGEHSGLFAIAYAARLLAMRPHTQLLLAGGVDELSYELLELHTHRFPQSDACTPVVCPFQHPNLSPIPAEGAACLALTRQSIANAHQWPILARISGIATAGTEDISSAIQRCLAGSDGAIDAIYSAAHFATASREYRLLYEALGASLSDIPLFAPSSLLGAGMAFSSACACVAAVEAIYTQTLHMLPHTSQAQTSLPNRRPLHRILVVANDSTTGSCILAIESHEKMFDKIQLPGVE